MPRVDQTLAKPRRSSRVGHPTDCSCVTGPERDLPATGAVDRALIMHRRIYRVMVVRRAQCRQVAKPRPDAARPIDGSRARPRLRMRSIDARSPSGRVRAVSSLPGVCCTTLASGQRSLGWRCARASAMRMPGGAALDRGLCAASGALVRFALATGCRAREISSPPTATRSSPPTICGLRPRGSTQHAQRT